MNTGLAEILNHPTDLVVVADRDDLKIKEVSPSVPAFFRRTKEQCIGYTVYEIAGLEQSKKLTGKVIAAIRSFGVYADNTSSPDFSFLFTLVQCPDMTCCLIRITSVAPDVRLMQYSMLIENSVAGIFQSYVNGGIIDCNTAFANMLGYADRAEVLSTWTLDHYPLPEDRGRFIEDLRAEKKLVNYEIHLKKKDGSDIWCLENTYLTVSPEGKEIINGTIIDITRQKLAERAHLESEERLSALAAVSHESVVFFNDREIVDCNDQFVKMFGYTSRRDVTGLQLTQFFSPPDVKKLLVAMDISASNKVEVRTSNRDGQPLILDVTGVYIRLKGESLRVFVIADITARKKAEFTLEQTVLRLRNVLENSPNAILITTDDKIRYSNQAALNLLGVIYEDDIYDADMIRFIAPEFASQIADDFEAVRQGNDVDYKEIRIRDTAGEEIDVGFKSTLTVYENRPSVQISITNISERMQLIQEQMRIRIIEEINTVLKKEIEEHKRTQRRLQAQQNYTRNLIESSLDMIIATDRDGNISEFNKAAEVQFGYDREEVMGRPANTLFWKSNDEERMRNILRDEGQFFGEIRTIRKSGEVFTSLLSASQIKDDKDRVIGSMGVYRDITEYRAQERTALEQKAKLESIFNSTANMMMWTMDRSYRATTMNTNFKSWLQKDLGESAQIGENIFQLLKNHVDEDLYQNQLEAFESGFEGRPGQFEFALRTAGGSTIWLQAFLNPVYLDGIQEEISCLMYDTTERKTIDRRIREALKEKEVLLQEIHHRVKNNLQVISSILNLQSSYVHDNKTLEILQESQNRIKSMAFIHETLYRTTDFSSIDFSDYLRTLSFNLIQSYRLTDCRVEFAPELDPVNIHIDQAIPCGLIANELISNALKYAFKGRTCGRLFLELRQRGNVITIRVADDGSGLPSDFQHDKTDSLGVQLVYTLTDQLDGKIEVNSEPGKGTEFLITFEMIERTSRR